VQHEQTIKGIRPGFCLSQEEEKSAEEQDSVTLFSALNMARAWKINARRVDRTAEIESVHGMEVTTSSACPHPPPTKGKLTEHSSSQTELR